MIWKIIKYIFIIKVFIFIAFFVLVFVFINSMFEVEQNAELDKSSYVLWQFVTSVIEEKPKWSPITWWFSNGTFVFHISWEWVSAVDFTPIPNSLINSKEFNKFDKSEYKQRKITVDWWRSVRPLKVFSTISWTITQLTYKWKHTNYCKYVPNYKVEWNSYWRFIEVTNDKYRIRFWHFDSINSHLEVWQKIWYWTLLWIMWNTWCSTWPHLHYEVASKWALWWWNNISTTQFLSMLWDDKKIDKWNFRYYGHIWFAFDTWMNSIDSIDITKTAINEAFNKYWVNRSISSNVAKSVAFQETKWSQYAVSWAWAAWIRQFIKSTREGYKLNVPNYSNSNCTNTKWRYDYSKEYAKSLWCNVVLDDRFNINKSIKALYSFLWERINSETCNWNVSCWTAFYNWWNWTKRCKEYFDDWLYECYSWIINSGCSNNSASHRNISNVCNYTSRINQYEKTFKEWKMPNYIWNVRLDLK